MVFCLVVVAVGGSIGSYPTRVVNEIQTYTFPGNLLGTRTRLSISNSMKFVFEQIFLFQEKSDLNIELFPKTQYASKRYDLF